MRANFGHPIRAFLKRLVEDPETYTKQAQALVEKFIRKVGAQGDPWTQRFATKFGVVYAAAMYRRGNEDRPVVAETRFLVCRSPL